jgi:hypothetical protein
MLALDKIGIVFETAEMDTMTGVNAGDEKKKPRHVDHVGTIRVDR